MIFEKKLIKTVLIFFIGLLIVSCSKDDPAGSLSISAKATLTKSANKTVSAKNAVTEVTISDFLVNIEEFELEMDDNEQDDDNEQWDDDGYYDFEDDLELEGPFELNLMQGQVSFLGVDVPNGTFEEIEFKFDESTDATSDLFGKSVLIKGTIDGTPFIFWHDFDDEIEVDFDEPQFDLVVQNGPNSVVIDFDLSLLFDTVNGIDLSQATDNNEDGTIEISPNDNDGNNELAHQLKDKFKTLIDLLDD